MTASQRLYRFLPRGKAGTPNTRPGLVLLGVVSLLLSLDFIVGFEAIYFGRAPPSVTSVLGLPILASDSSRSATVQQRRASVIATFLDERGSIKHQCIKESGYWLLATGSARVAPWRRSGGGTEAPEK